MSYCRRGIDGSDVTLVYDHERKLWDCAPCSLVTGAISFATPWATLAHMHEHRAHDHVVPDHVFGMLKAESEDWPPTEADKSEDKS